MKEEQPLARSSMVPVLGCIALMLFSLSSYKIFDKEFLSKWRSSWCQTNDHHLVEIHQHDGVFAFEFDGAERDIERAHRELERANRLQERVLRRNMEEAKRTLVQLQSQQRIDDVHVQVDIERLQEEMEAKMRHLEEVQHDLEFTSAPLDWQCEMDHETHSDVQIHVLR